MVPVEMQNYASPGHASGSLSSLFQNSVGNIFLLVFMSILIYLNIISSVGNKDTPTITSTVIVKPLGKKKTWI